MNQQDVLNILKKEDICRKLDTIGQIHMLTKHYLLIAEEISEEGVTFLQPLKEHRDAYDHMMRVFYLPRRLEDPKVPAEFDRDEYIETNVEKALGHEYRAFFDMADWLTFICRRKIREELSLRRVKQAYTAKYGEDAFQKAKKLINTVSFEIAQYRTEKDIGKKGSSLSDVLNYKGTIDQLLEIYKQVMMLNI